MRIEPEKIERHDEQQPAPAPPSPTAEPPGETPGERVRGRTGLLRALVGGLVLGVSIGWFVAYLAVLPGFLGLFFFLLVGLLIGASMYRLGKPAAPAPAGALLSAGIVVALAVWLTSLVAEYRWLAGDAARAAVKASVTQHLTAEQVADYRGATERRVIEQLARDYPPGGFAGFLRWSATSRELNLPRAGGGPSLVFKPSPARPLIWVLRISLSLVLVLFTILSQFMGLVRVEDKPSAGFDDKPAM